MFMSVALLTRFQSGTASQAHIWMRLDCQPSQPHPLWVFFSKLSEAKKKLEFL